MDSSNRLRWVLEGQSFHLYEFSHQELIKIFRGGIDRMKHLLKYLPDFEPISKHLNQDWIPGGGRRQTAKEIVAFPAEVDERTRVTLVRTLEDTQVETTRLTKELYLTEKGELLLWEARYDREEAINRSVIRERAVVSRFTLLTDEAISTNLAQPHMWKEDWKEILYRTLELLLRSADDCAEKLEERSRNVREGRRRLHNIVGVLRCN